LSPRGARPEPPAEREPAVETIAAGSELVRLYRRRFGPIAFNPNAEAEGRFRPVHDAAEVVATIYLADDQETALAEVLLRGVDALAAGNRPRLYRRQVLGISMARIEVRRELRLVRLRGQGLTRLGLRREELIMVGPPEYSYTARWAQAFYESPEEFDGIVWTSHQNDSGRALMLWEGRVDPDVDLSALAGSVPLDRDPGLDLVRQAALAAGFSFEG
jgi:hypothetical protein